MSPSNKKPQKEFVADQPGLGLSFVGLFLALFMGLALRATFPAEKIKVLVQNAADKVNADLEFKIGNAYFSLSNGIFPELAVRISDVVMISKSSCWMSPQAEIDQIRLPLSLFKILQGQAQISRVEIKNLNLTLKENLKDCETKSVAAIPTQVSKEAKPTRIEAEAAPITKLLTHQKNSIETVFVQKMYVSYLPLAFTSFSVLNFEATLKSESPKIIVLRGLLSAGGETLSGDYSSTAELFFEYSEATTPVWKSRINGSWREGHYEAAIDYWPDTHKYNWQGEIKQLPLSQLFPLLKKYQLMSSDFNGKQAWLSMQSRSEGSAIDAKNSSVEVQKVKIEGNLGEASAENIKFSSLKPLRYDPVQIALKGVDISQLLVFLNRPHPSQALASLGVFDGEAVLDPSQKVNIKGIHRGLEFIFSNKGSREIQRVDSMEGNFKLDGPFWQIDVRNLKPKGGEFAGDIKIRADRDWKEVNIESKIQKLLLSVPVQNLMTAQGHLGPLSGNLSAKLISGELVDIRGRVDLGESLIEKMAIQKMNLNLETKNKITFVDIRSPDVRVADDAPAKEFLVKNFNLQESSKVELKNISIRAQTDSLNSFKWTTATAQIGSGMLDSQGGWEKNEELQGFVRIKEKNRENKWNLQGHRFQPKFLKN